LQIKHDGWGAIRTLINAVMGFWTVQRGLIRQFFTHNTYNLYADNYLIQTFRLAYHDRHPHTNAKSNCRIELPNCQSEFVSPD
jgi:hypothetical protein